MRQLNFFSAPLGVAALLTAACLAATAPASAAEYEVKMLNKGEAGVVRLNLLEPARVDP